MKEMTDIQESAEKAGVLMTSVYESEIHIVDPYGGNTLLKESFLPKGMLIFRCAPV